jgi:putative ABC transport system permease protein
MVSASNISIRLREHSGDAIDRIRERYEASFPGEVFSYYFLDDYYATQYNSEQQSGKLFTAFSALAIVVGCLGLWALASFSALHRMKEISIRKVLGASTGTIVLLLGHQFLKPLVMASMIALPLAWWGMHQWLEQFPYRIGLSFDLFLVPVLLLAIIAIITISTQTLRAASANPVQHLKE